MLVAQSQLDFVKELESNSELKVKLGLEKLTSKERAAWNDLLNRVYLMGMNATSERQSAATGTATSGAQVGAAYISRIDDDDGDILKLDNGAIIEVPYGYIGYLGYRRECVLFKEGSRWRLWIKDKKTYSCNVLQPPHHQLRRSAERLNLSKVLGNGKILEMSDGTLYEVNDLYLIDTALWLGGSEVLLLDGFQLINLDEGGELVDVSRLVR